MKIAGTTDIAIAFAVSGVKAFQDSDEPDHAALDGFFVMFGLRTQISVLPLTREALRPSARY